MNSRDKGSMILELQERLQSTAKQLSSAKGTGPENTVATRFVIIL